MKMASRKVVRAMGATTYFSVENEKRTYIKYTWLASIAVTFDFDSFHFGKHLFRPLDAQFYAAEVLFKKIF